MSDSPRLASLKAKLASRERNPSFATNCEDIRLEIARLETEAKEKES